MDPIELRDLDAARRYILDGLLLQRALKPTAKTVKPALEWAMEIASGGHPLPPIGFVADVGNVALGVDAEQRVREAQPVPGWPPALGRSYEDHVLGKLYADCWGVSANYGEMVKLHLRAAEQGYVQAQDHLGYLYAYGVGVPVDNVQAYFWYNRAASQGGGNDADKRDLIAKKLTPEQLQAAQRLVQNWTPK